MKKLVIISIVAAMLLASGAAFAQTAATDAASHEVRIVIPEVVMIRLTNGTSSSPVTTNTAVTFDLSSVAADDLIGTHDADVTDAWDDVKVFVNRNVTWNVAVAVAQTAGPADVTFPWNQVSVTPSGLASPFTLSTAGTSIASSTERGWQSLGFGQSDFALELFGSEIVGDYTATVTYTLTAP